MLLFIYDYLSCKQWLLTPVQEPLSPLLSSTLIPKTATPSGRLTCFSDNGSDERRVIILSTSDNLNMLAESNSWYLDGTFKCFPQLFYQVLIIHAQLSSDDRTWCLPRCTSSSPTRTTPCIWKPSNPLPPSSPPWILTA